MINVFKYAKPVTLFFGFVTCLVPSYFVTPVLAQSSAASEQLDERYETCISLIAQDAGLGYEEALIWKGDGGGRRARHCVAMALYALGHHDEAAYRLEKLAGETFNGTASMRAEYYAEAADFWLASGDETAAYRAATAGLELSEGHLGLRLIRARAYAQLKRWDYAEIDLTSALAHNPGDAKALRYRADARRRLGDLNGALSDITSAMAAEPLSVENAVVRGEIREEIRIKSINK